MNITALSALNAPLPAVFSAAPPDGTALASLFTQHSPHFLSTFRFEATEQPTYAFPQWSKPHAFAALLARYQQELYGAFPDKTPETKALYSLWAQWYFGLLIPPVMLLLLRNPLSLDMRWQRFRVGFHDSGRPEFLLYQPALLAECGAVEPLQRLTGFITHHLRPVVTAIEAGCGLNRKLTWSNIGYVMHWYLGELKPLIGDAVHARLQQALFSSDRLPGEQDENPLYRTMILRHGILQRRTCCQRYKLPNVNACPDCPLNLT